MTNTKYIVIIPAYNEESTILECLNHILDASHTTEGYTLEKIIVCINGCTDNTELVTRSWSGAPIEIIKSKPGYINAMNRLFRYAKKYYPNSMMVKTDADGVVDKDAFLFLFEQFEKHPDIIVVGGHPSPISSSSQHAYRRFMSKLLSVRSRTPEAEITITNTAKLHPYATADPILELKGREEKLKVYFHGRLWCARTPQSIPLLPQGIIGDDVYLPGWLLKEHGPNSMRLDYRARVWFHPNDSLLRHWKVYRRIHEDRHIVYSIDGFEEYADACPLKLDWKYIINTCPLNEAIYFIIYAAVVAVEKFSYKFAPYDTTYWQYSKKEV